MDALTTLLTQYSGADVVIIVFLVLIAVKFIWETIDWFRNKLKDKYEDDEENKDKYEKVIDEIRALNVNVEGLAKEMVSSNDSFRSDLNDVKDNLYDINQRLLETMRSQIIDKHHKYMAAGKITDFSLQSLERQYNYYSSAGGNTFIDNLMDDIRSLPVVDSDKAIGEEEK